MSEDRRKQLLRESRNGDRRSQFILGTRLYLGHLGFEDTGRKEKGLKWILRSAMQGYPKAEYLYGLIAHHEGRKEGAAWIEKAARGGLATAQARMASMQTGDSAVEWYLKAGLRGDPDAQREAGRRLLYGMGVPKDRKKGRRWTREAAMQGHRRAQGEMALQNVFDHDTGGQKESSSGEGYGEKLTEAYMWATLSSLGEWPAEEHRYKNLRKIQDSLRKRLPRREVRKAVDAAIQWRERFIGEG